MSFFEDVIGLIKGLTLVAILGTITIAGGASLISPMFDDTEPSETELRQCFDRLTADVRKDTINGVYVQAIFDLCDKELTVTAYSKAFRLSTNAALVLLAIILVNAFRDVFKPGDFSLSAARLNINWIPFVKAYKQNKENEKFKEVDQWFNVNWRQSPSLFLDFNAGKEKSWLALKMRSGIGDHFRYGFNHFFDFELRLTELSRQGALSKRDVVEVLSRLNKADYCWHTFSYLARNLQTNTKLKSIKAQLLEVYADDEDMLTRRTHELVKLVEKIEDESLKVHFSEFS